VANPNTMIARLAAALHDEDGKVAILLDPRLVLVRAVPKRAHQGWRYLEEKDAPPDLGDGEADARDVMPSKMLGDLMKMGLV